VLEGGGAFRRLPHQDKPPHEPIGLPSIGWLKHNPYSAAKGRPGRYLYFDQRLSVDETISCATCHNPKQGFGDGAAVSTGIKGQKGTGEVKVPLPTPSRGVIPTKWPWPFSARARATAAVRQGLWQRRNHLLAVATFEHTIRSGNSPYGRYKKGNKKAMTPEQVHGISVFFDKAMCDRCQENANFTLN
jgi:cytochrome c peroxidase